MGKMSELAAELAELKHCGEVLIGISETLTEMFSGADEEPAAEAKSEEKPAKKAEKKAKAKDVTFAEVRAVLAEKSRQGHRPLTYVYEGSKGFSGEKCQQCKQEFLVNTETLDVFQISKAV